MEEWSRKMPWRQGHLLSDDAVQALNLVPPQALESTVVIIASHDCDILQPPEKEPMIEVIVGSLIPTLEGHYIHAKNTRRLHVQFEGSSKLLVEFNTTDKKSIDKKLLANYTPNVQFSLSPSSKNTFQCWLAARYHRSAFPDEFEKRLKNVDLDKAIANTMKKHGGFIIAILFDVDNGNVLTHSGIEDAYKLGIILIYEVDNDPVQAQNEAEKAKESIESIFRKKSSQGNIGIELEYVDAISEEALTYRQYRILKIWRLDHISLGSEPQQSMPA